MARMPGARWRPLAANWSSQPRLTRHDLVLIHTAVGSFDGTFAYFANSGGYTGAESHFMTSGAGAIDQYQDTAYQAEANGAANGRAISVENADMGAGFAAWNTGDGNAVPAFTPAQVEANARICAWAHQAYGIPLELIPDSKPGRRGIGYHRLGVPGYAVPGGELWSSARGKVCPGPRRIAQIPQIIERARQIAGGVPVVQPGGFLMALSDQQQQELYARVMGFLQQRFDAEGKPARALDSLDGAYLLQQIAATRTGGVDLEALRPVLVEAVREGMAAGNDATADDIVDQLAARLANG